MASNVFNLESIIDNQEIKQQVSSSKDLEKIIIKYMENRLHGIEEKIKTMNVPQDIDIDMFKQSLKHQIKLEIKQYLQSDYIKEGIYEPNKQQLETHINDKFTELLKELTIIIEKQSKEEKRPTEVTLNLDNYKDLFKEIIHKVDREIGFNLHYDEITKNIGFEITKGLETTVTIPYNNIVTIHSHPRSIGISQTFEYHPPTQLDFIGSCFDYFHGSQLEIVVEKAGIWIYKPNDELIKEMNIIQPNANEIFSEPLIEGEEKKQIFGLSKEFDELHDVILTNTSNEGVNLNFTKSNIPNIFKEVFISTQIQKTGNASPKMIELYSRQAEQFASYLPPEKLRPFIPQYHKISLDEYINNINNIVTDDGTGFDIKFIKWDEPFNINFKLNENAHRVFDEIKSRKHIFTEKDRDVIMSAFPRTGDNYIIKK
jgi:hypothetical protein